MEINPDLSKMIDSIKPYIILSIETSSSSSGNPPYVQGHRIIKKNKNKKKINKGRSPSNGKLSDFSFYIDSQISVHRKFKK